jgi:L-alanine-DL-glutamate epimerase-like enolase superfamily enzyme
LIKIADVRATAVSVPLIYPFKAAYGIRDTADFVLVEIEDNYGRIGLGEASTIPIYDEGSQAGVIYVLEKYIKPVLLERDPRDINQLNGLIAGIIKGERYLKCAIDFALHDLAGKIYNLSVSQLLGGYPKPVQVCWVLSAKNPESIREEAARKKGEGFHVFKLKVGIDPKSDLANLEALRETIGEELEIRLDGNEAWNPKEALRQINSFLPYSPAHIEQPVPAWDVEGLSYLCLKSSLPLSADEVVLTAADSMRLARFGAGDRINIKISRCGGFGQAKRIMAIAEAANQKPFLGSMLELGLGTVASAHFAAAFTNMELATELVGPLLLRQDILEKPLTYSQGYLQLPEGPGFGIALNRVLIEEYTVK